MKLDLALTLTDTVTNMPILLPADKDGKELPATLEFALVQSLLADDPKSTGEEKMKCWTLAKRLAGNKEVEISLEDAAYLKEMVLKYIVSKRVAGSVVDILEGK